MPWRVENREGGSGARRGVGDSGGVWEALAVAARCRDTPEPPPCSPHGALKQPRQAGDSDQKHSHGYQARTPGSCFPWYQINLIKTITVTVTCGFR